MPTHRRLMPGGPLLLAAMVLVACAGQRTEVALQARDTLRGMPKAQLLSCAGVPVRVLEDQGAEYLTYVSGRTQGTGRSSLQPRVGVGVGSWGGGVGYSLGLGLPAESYETRSCEATFRIEDGTVTNVTYVTPDTGSNRHGACYPIIENCVVGLRD